MKHKGTTKKSDFAEKSECRPLPSHCNSDVYSLNTRKPHTLLDLLKARFEKMKVRGKRAKQHFIHPAPSAICALTGIYSCLRAGSLSPAFSAPFSQQGPSWDPEMTSFFLHMAQAGGHHVDPGSTKNRSSMSFA